VTSFVTRELRGNRVITRCPQRRVLHDTHPEVGMNLRELLNRRWTPPVGGGFDDPGEQKKTDPKGRPASAPPGRPAFKGVVSDDPLQLDLLEELALLQEDE